MYSGTHGKTVVAYYCFMFFIFYFSKKSGLYIGLNFYYFVFPAYLKNNDYLQEAALAGINSLIMSLTNFFLLEPLWITAALHSRQIRTHKIEEFCQRLQKHTVISGQTSFLGVLWELFFFSFLFFLQKQHINGSIWIALKLTDSLAGLCLWRTTASSQIDLTSMLLQRDDRARISQDKRKDSHIRVLMWVTWGMLLRRLGLQAKQDIEWQ